MVENTTKKYVRLTGLIAILLVTFLLALAIGATIAKFSIRNSLKRLPKL